MISIRNVVVPVDFSPPAASALSRAIGLARELGARLHLLHCYEVPAAGLAGYQLGLPERLWEQIGEAAERRLEEWRARATSAGVEADAHVSRATAPQAIRAHAEKAGAELIVMGTRGHTGFKHLLLGSVAERTVREAPCPVLTVKAADETSAPQPPSDWVRCILAPIDFSEPSSHALEVAMDWAERFDASIELLHAFHLPAMVSSPYEIVVSDGFFEVARRAAQEELDRSLERVRGRGLRAEAVLAESPAALGIVHHAEKRRIDLVVLGTHGHTGVRHALLGSVAERTLRLAPCSVLAVRQARG